MIKELCEKIGFSAEDGDFFEECLATVLADKESASKFFDAHDDYFGNGEIYFDTLGEIAENNGISRQGVRDVIVRAEATMQEFEDKTGLIRRFQQMQDSINVIVESAAELKTIRLPLLMTRSSSALMPYLPPVMASVPGPSMVSRG